MNTPLEWITTQRKVNDLIPLEINPRKISEAKRMKMIESLQRFNLVDIPVIDTDGTIISGHQRLRALQAIGRGDEMVDCRLPNRKLTDKEIKEYNLLANSHFGEFDFDALETGFADVDFDLVPIDLSKIEFEQSDMFDKAEKQFIKVKENNAQPEAQEDDFEMPDENAVTTDIVIGDLFEIGEHRLLCGDSTDSDAVAKLMNGEKADLLLTDPPYGIEADKGFVGFVGFGGFGPPIARRQYTDDWDSKRPDQNTFILILSTAKNAIIFGGNFFADILPTSKHWLVWDKLNTMPTFGDCELAWTNIERNSVKKYTVQYNGLIGKEKERFHPTQKPVKIISDILQDYSEIQNTVNDYFLGSGTTMVASHQLQRKCYGMELDPKYCQVIINRMLKLDPTLVIKKNGELYAIKN
jgi:DNA modification methylase